MGNKLQFPIKSNYMPQVKSNESVNYIIFILNIQSRNNTETKLKKEKEKEKEEKKKKKKKKKRKKKKKKKKFSLIKNHFTIANI